MSNDITAQQGLELAKQITILTSRINITNSIVYYLSVRGSIPELIQELKNMGYRIKGDDLKVDLERVIGLSKSDHVKLAAANDAYSKLEKGEKSTELTWYQMLSALAKHRQITSINPSLITVMEYCAMHNEYKEYCDYMSRVHK